MVQNSRLTRPEVVVVGAGAAGLAAATALAGANIQPLLLERRAYVGGRAYSYEHPAAGETIDSQHVLLGCCTNLIDLCRQAGIADKIKWYSEIAFLEAGEKKSVLRSGALPSPAHSAFSFIGLPTLTLEDKAGIAAGLMQFLRDIPSDDSESFADWVRRTGQTEHAVKHLWEPVIISTLNDVFERCSTKYAAMVFRESLLKSARGGRLGVPTLPMSEFFSAVAQYAESLGAEVRLRCGVEAIHQNGHGWTVETSDGPIETPAVVLALPFEQAEVLLRGLPASTGREKLLGDIAQFVHAPITTIHLWFDREITVMEQAALLDTRIQWMFQKSRIRRWAPDRGSYIELVISASHAELAMSPAEILSSALRELDTFFPAARYAKLVKSVVLKEARATFSVLPGLDAHRPAQATEWPGLFLAGDWTRTGWPSTMEGGVRSGRLAAEAVTGKKFITPDAAPQGLMRLFS